MKILLISPKAPPVGGIATWTEAFLNSSYIKKNDVDLINIAVTGKRKEIVYKYNILEELVRFVKILKELKKSLKNSKYHVIHINSSCSKMGLIREYLCVKMASKTNAKLIIHFHCDMTYMIKNKIQENLVKKILNKVNKVFVLNTVSLKYVKELNETVDARIVPNFIENEKVIENDKIINKEVKNAIYVGRVSFEKGCDIIFKIADKFPKIRFKLIGQISDEFKKIEKIENVELLGEKDNQYVLEELKNADLFIFPTHTEGFPCALLEAMAQGVPIITTPVGAIPDMIEDTGGIYCQVNNEKEFECAIKKIQYDYDLKKKMSKWNVNKVLNNYTKEIVVKKILKLYREA